MPLLATLCIKALHLDLQIPLDIHTHVREAQATLGHPIGSITGENDGVDQAHGTPHDFRYEEPFGDAHLWSR